MAALRQLEDSTNRLVLQSRATAQLGSLLSNLAWVGLLLVFFLPSIASGEADWTSLGLIVAFVLLSVGSGIVSSLMTTRIIIDRTSRTLTNMRRFVGIPISTTSIPLKELASIEYEPYRHVSGRSSHEAWRVMGVARDGRRTLLNWDGKEEEIKALARKVAAWSGAELVDRSAQQLSTAEEIIARTEAQAEQPTASRPPEPAAAERDEQPPVYAPWTTSPAETPAAEPPELPTAPMTGEMEQPADIRRLSVQELERRAQGDPLDAEVRHLLARRYHARGQMPQAIEMYKQVLHVEPTNASAQNDLAVALQQQGKRAEAEAAFRRAVALDPFSSRAHLNLGLLLRSMNRGSDASQEFYLARQNARTDAERSSAESASTGAKLEPQLSQI